MAFIEKQLGQSLLTVTGTLIYTVPSEKTAILKHLVFTNLDTAKRAVSLWFIPSGGSLGDSNRMLNAVSVEKNDVLDWTIFQVLTEGAAIWASTDLDNKITFTISGAEV